LAGAPLTERGNFGFFGALGVAMLINTLSLAKLRNHIDRS
jgi:hypothetical protein